MASAGIRYGWNCNLLDRRFVNVRTPPNQNAGPFSLMIRNHTESSSRGKRGNTISAAVATTATMEASRSLWPATRLGIVESEGNRSNTEAAAVVYEKLDEWMRESVTEIVKNLREAPLLVQVYNENNDQSQNDGLSLSPPPPRMVMEKAVTAENWAVAQSEWEAGEATMPEGLIFVEELADDSERHEKEEYDVRNDGFTRAWGVVIQGKGAECPPACYLLKTSTAGFGSGCGFGFGCTHFCLVRVNSFRETTESQLKNCWLLQAQAKAQGL